jgi:adenine deaminase
MVPVRRPLAEVTRDLVAAATGKLPADKVIRGGRVVNVFTGEILPWDVAIKGERIATVGDAGHTIGPEEIASAMQWPGICGLGEMMNFPGVLAGDARVHGELKATMKAGKPVTGHYSMPGDFQGLAAYATAGIVSCHESVLAEDALNRMRLGIYAKMREGSAWHDVKATVKSLTETGVHSRRAILVSDDTHPDTLLSAGHLNHVVRRAISEGLDPVRAIQAVTINVAECFNVSRDLGP